MTEHAVLTSINDGICTITLNRPDRLNAMPPQMADEIGAAFYDLGDSRAVLITGAGKGFCSGADLAARGEKADRLGVFGLSAQKTRSSAEKAGGFL